MLLFTGLMVLLKRTNYTNGRGKGRQIKKCTVGGAVIKAYTERLVMSIPVKEKYHLKAIFLH